MRNKSWALLVCLLLSIWVLPLTASAAAAKPSDPPEITVKWPIAGSVNGTLLHIEASTSSNHNPVKLTVHAEDELLFDGRYAINDVFDLTAHAGKLITLTFSAKNKLGETSTKTVPVFVGTTSPLSLIDQVNGTIEDMNLSQILYSTADYQLRIKNRESGADELVSQLSGIKEAAITDNGTVIFSELIVKPSGSEKSGDLFMWKNNSVTQLTYAGPDDYIPPSIVLNDRNLVVYYDSAGNGFILDTETGTIKDLGGPTERASAAPDGSLILTVGKNIYTYRAGEELIQINKKEHLLFGGTPLTDGTRHLYNAGDFMGDLYIDSLILIENGNATELTADIWALPEAHMNNGYIVFFEHYENPERELIRRTPQGEELQIADGETSEFLHMEPDGTVYFRNSASGPIFRNKPTGPGLYSYEVDQVDRLPVTAYPGVVREGDKWFKLNAAKNKLYSIGEESQTDIVPPSWPSAGSLSATEKTSHSLRLHWQPAADDAGVLGYRVYMYGREIALVTSGTTYQVTGLEHNTLYRFDVQAFDTSGNISDELSGYFSTTTPDVTSPQWPAGDEILSVSEVTYSSAHLSWQPASDNVGVRGYKLYQDQQEIAVVTGTTYQVTGLEPSTLYTFHAAAFDAAGNISNPSPPLSVMTATYTPEPEPALLSLTAKPGFYDVGSTLEVTVRAEEVQDLYAFLLKTRYDPAILRLTQAQLSRDFGIEGQTAIIGKQMNTAGQAVFPAKLLGAVPGHSGDVRTVVLKFTVLAQGSGTVELLTGTSLTDSSGRISPLATPVTLTLHIGGADVDGDGLVGLSDLAEISRHSGMAAGQPGFDARYDLNNDSVVDAKDVQYVANKLAKSTS